MRAAHSLLLWATPTTIRDSDSDPPANMESSASGMSPMTLSCCWFWTKRKWPGFPAWPSTGMNFPPFPSLLKRRSLARHLDLLSWLTGVVGNGLGHVEGGIFSAHVVCAHLAFRYDACDRRLKTCGHFSFFEPIKHQLRR